MSRGFVKEDDLEHAGTELPERPMSPHANYVTPAGLAALESAAKKLEAERGEWLQRKEAPNAQQALAIIARDLRYYSARLEQAILVDTTGQDKQRVLFGAEVEVEDETGVTHHFHIVGEDEADILQHKVSYVSPIARALLGRKVGDQVVWQRPAGNIGLEIIAIKYQHGFF